MTIRKTVVILIKCKICGMKSPLQPGRDCQYCGQMPPQTQPKPNLSAPTLMQIISSVWRKNTGASLALHFAVVYAISSRKHLTVETIASQLGLEKMVRDWWEDCPHAHKHLCETVEEPLSELKKLFDSF